MGYIKDTVDGPGYTAPRPQFTLEETDPAAYEQKRGEVSEQLAYLRRQAAAVDVEFRGTGGPMINRPASYFKDDVEESLSEPDEVTFDTMAKPLSEFNVPGGQYTIGDPRTVQPGEVRSVDPRTGAQKGTKLARFDLIPQGPLAELAEHFGRGAGKYEDNQWRAGYDWSKSYAALQRHLSAFWSGEDLDPDPAMEGASHLAAAAWHVFALMEFTRIFPLGDDRWAAPDRTPVEGIDF